MAGKTDEAPIQVEESQGPLDYFEKTNLIG